MMQDIAQADGTIAPITGPAAKFSRTPTRVRTGAPALGANTDEVLAELGIDASTRAPAREEGHLIRTRERSKRMQQR
jgi:formyl-CoA transferase